MNRHYLFPLTKAQFEQVEHDVKQTLVSFASSDWGEPNSWLWLPEPQYHNAEAKSYSHPWLGAIYKQAPQLQDEFITPEDGLAVYLQGSRTFYVSVFRDYGYNIENASVAYLTVTEVCLRAGTTNEELLAGIVHLHAFLQSNPVRIRTRGMERPDPGELKIEIAPGIQLIQRVIAKHS